LLAAELLASSQHLVKMVPDRLELMEATCLILRVSGVTYLTVLDIRMTYIRLVVGRTHDV